MGSGSSKNDPAVIERLDRIEGLLDGMSSSKTPDQIVKQGQVKDDKNAPSPEDSGRRRSSVTFTEHPPPDLRKAVSSVAVVSGVDEESKREALLENKKKQQEVKARRKSFFEKYKWGEAMPPTVGNVKCSAIGCIALALSQLVAKHGFKITVADIFCDLKLPIHLVTLPSLTIAEVYDITAKFISASEKIKDLGIVAKVVHFDVDHVPTEDEGFTLEPVLSLLGFRKELAIDMQDTQVTHILNYDPYIVQEDAICKMVDEEEELDEEENAEEANKKRAIQKEKIASLRRYKKKNQGAFGVLSSYNPTLHNVQISSVFNTEEGIQVMQEDVALRTLYDACSSRDRYTERPRGYVKVSMTEQKTENDHRRIDSTDDLLFAMPELEASVDKGVRLELIDPQISPHIVGIGLAIHLFNAKNKIQIPRYRSFFGVAVSDVCSVLKLPIQVVTEGSDRTGLGKAYTFLYQYLQHQNCNDVSVSVVSMTRKENADDGLPNIDDTDLESQIIDVKKKNGSNVMLLNFDVNKSHNVIGLESEGKLSHFGVMTGYNESTQIVAIADVSPKKFKKIWYTPLQRLWNSMIGFGYIILSSDSDSTLFEGHKQCADQFLTSGLFKSPPPPYKIFEFPPRIYCVTVVALALQLLNCVTTVENVTNALSIPLSFLLSDHLSLGDLERIFLSYLEHSNLITKVKLDRCNFDVLASSGKQRVTYEDFKSLLENNKASESVIIFNYSFTKLADLQADWNGATLGSYGILQSYDSAQDIVTILSVSPDVHRRSWCISLSTLHSLCSEVDPVSGRSRGILVASLKANRPAYDKNISITCMPVEHPFKPPISPAVACMAFAFSLLGHRTSAEDIFYSSCLQDEGDRLPLHTLSHHIQLQKITMKAKETIKQLSYPLTVEVVQLDSLEKIQKQLADEKVCLMAIASVSKALDIVDNNVTCAIISSTTDSHVVCTEANPTKYGTHWSCSPERFLKATTQEADYNGIIKFSRTT